VLGAHVVLGALRLRSARGAAGVSQESDAIATSGGPSRGLRMVHAALGLIVVGFLVVHWPMVAWSDGPHTTVRDVYARLWTQLGTPPQLALHTLGIAAVSAHVGLGLGRAAVTLGFAQSKTERSVYTWLAALFGGLLFVLWLQVLATFAVGQPLF
jgi:hypothetical protein